MLDRICQYSTIIFAGNVVVLIIVSVATDYWEYRGIKLKKIQKEIGEVKKVHKTAIEFPGNVRDYWFTLSNCDRKSKICPASLIYWRRTSWLFICLCIDTESLISNLTAQWHIFFARSEKFPICKGILSKFCYQFDFILQPWFQKNILIMCNLWSVISIVCMVIVTFDA